jgi:signal transduction histidine kinase
VSAEDRRGEALSSALTEYRVRTVRIGVIATVFVMVALFAYVIHPGQDEVKRAPSLIVMGIGLLGAFVVAALPWRRLFERGLGMYFMYAWSILDILLVTVLISFAGDSHMEVFFLYAFTTIFFAASYPPRSQVALMAFTFACYLTVMGLQGWPIETPDMFARLGLLLVLAYMATFLARELQHEMRGASEARVDADRRAALLQQSVKRLAELDRMKSDFISNVSHELRTPLTAIEGIGVTLERHFDTLAEETQREFLGHLNANATSLHQIITTLLDFAKIEAGRLDLEVQDVQVRSWLEALLTRLRAITDTHSVSVDAPADVVVRGDPILLDRVIENLLSNAVKHTPHGTRVTLAASTHDGQATISVSDDGPGIPASELPYLGERFFRGGGPMNRQTHGTGLGLAFAREILRLHGSDLEVDSEQGRGSRFSFRLPVSRSLSGQG